jgi:hypothetical protein
MRLPSQFNSLEEMMLVCSSGRGCEVRKDWPSQRCPSFKLCGGMVIEKKKTHAKNNNYQHMGDAKDFLEQILYVYLPQDVIDIVYEYFGPGTVIFDFDRLVLMPKICKIEMPHWDNHTFWIEHYKVLYRDINRTIRIATHSDGNKYMEIHYWMFTDSGFHEIMLNYEQMDYSIIKESNITRLTLPLRSHQTPLMSLFGKAIMQDNFIFPPMNWKISFANIDE